MKKYRYVLLSLIILVIFASFLEPSFLTWNNLWNVMRQAGVLLLLSLGLTGVVLTGNIDLSVGSVAALTGCVCAKMMVSGYSIFFSIFASLFIGLMVGACNGILVGILDLPSFVSTYGMQMVTSGIALIVMNGGVIYDLPSGFTFLGIGYIGPVPFLIILNVILYILLGVLWGKTTFGRKVYMLGQNKLAAIYSGIDYLSVLFFTFIISGLGASIAGIIITARLNAADAGMCDAYGLQIVAAVVVGGSSLLGGEGGVTGTVFGAITLTVILNIMNMTGVESAWQNLILGILIILLVFISSKKTTNSISDE